LTTAASRFDWSFEAIFFPFVILSGAFPARQAGLSARIPEPPFNASSFPVAQYSFMV
jgi:hypothetical protein